MTKTYMKAANPNVSTDFPYLVREVAQGHSLSYDPYFHSMHWHPDLQFLYVVHGTLFVQTLEEKLLVKEGEGLFINKDVVHCIQTTVESADSAHYYNFLFPADQLRFYPGCPANDELARLLDGTSLPMRKLSGVEEWERETLHLLQALADREKRSKEEPALYAYEVLLQLFRLLLLVLQNCQLLASKQLEDVNTQRTKQVLQYINAHFAEDLSLDDLAHSASCSKSACLRAFRQCTKTTPFKYLIDYRLEQAAALLRQTKEPVSNIALATGFSHVSLFGKYFKEKTGKTPREYRLER